MSQHKNRIQILKSFSPVLVLHLSKETMPASSQPPASHALPPASPTNILHDFKNAVDAYLRPSVLNANPSASRPRRLAKTPSLVKEETIEVYVFENQRFQLNYITQLPLRISEAYTIDYISLSVQPYMTFGGGDVPNKISIMVRIFIRDTAEATRNIIKNVFFNHVVSTNPNESKVHIFYDSTIPIHGETYGMLKYLLVKLWMDTRELLRVKSLHGLPDTRLYNVLRDYISSFPDVQRDTLIRDVFNTDASVFQFQEEHMIIHDSGRPDFREKNYANFVDFLRHKETTGGRSGRAKRATSAPSAPSAKAKAKAKSPPAPSAKVKAKEKSKKTPSAKV